MRLYILKICVYNCKKPSTLVYVLTELVCIGCSDSKGQEFEF